MIPMAGERFGPYEILGTLGRGGVGEVYRAWDSRLEREIAIKLLHDDYPEPAARERFVIEGRAASALSHPNICTIFDMGEKDGAPYLVMELLKGETLKHRIERGGMAAEEIAQFGIEIADALGAAHAVGIVHRDVKPANIMLARHPDGRVRVKVVDFGLAKIRGILPSGISHDEHLTVPGEAVGTVAYMSPEQACGKELDGRSDLFSLGTVMYEMATRRTPFQGSTTPLLFVQLLNEDPEPIRDWNEEVPRALEKVIFRLLEKDPAKRFQSAEELIAALSAAIGRTGTTRKRKIAPPPVPLVRVEEPVARAGLPARPEPRRELGDAARLRDQRNATPASGRRDQTPAVVARRVSDDAQGAIRPVRLAAAPVQPAGEYEARIVGRVGRSDPEAPSTDAHSSAAKAEPVASPAEVQEIQKTVAARESSVRPPAPKFASEVALAIWRESTRVQIIPGVAAANIEPKTPLVELPSISTGVGAAEMAVQLAPESAELATPATLQVRAPEVKLESAEQPEYQEEPLGVAETVAESVPNEPEPWRGLRPAFAVPAHAAVAAQGIEAAGTPLEFERKEMIAVDDICSVAEESAEESRPGVRVRRRRLLWATAAGVTIAAALGLVRYVAGGKHALLASGQRVVVAGIENHTGAQMLDGSPAVALEFALAEDQRVPLVDEASFADALRGLSPDGRPVDVGTARQAALAAGADAYVYGEVAQTADGVHGSGAGYRLSVVLRDTHSDRELARAEAKSDRIEDLPGAVDRVAGSLLSTMFARPANAYVPVAREASASLGALHLYAAGIQAEAEGREAAALKAYSSAASNDPGFVQALLRISWLARAENANAASADAADRASAAAEGHSARTVLLARATEQANSKGDLQRAASKAKDLLKTNPKDEAARLLLARTQRMAGEFADASRTAQQGIAVSPRNGAMYAEAELALVGLNRANEAAAQMESAAAAGLSRPAFREMLDYLAGKAEAADGGAVTGSSGANEPGVLAIRGAFLDNTGDLSDAEESWARAADSVRGQSGLSGAANALLARAALNRALAGDCDRALTLAGSAAIGQTRDQDAALRAGVAAGLCADDDLAQTAEGVLSAGGSRGTIAEIRTALALGRGDEALAAREAKGIGPDPMYLGTYLRSMVHLEAEQPGAAIADLEEVLAHRGVVSLAGTNLYPVAQLALARAFAGSGDRSNSVEAYGRFKGLWDGAGAKDVLKVEASQAAHGVLPNREEILARLQPEARRPQVEQAAAPTDDRAMIVARPAVLHPQPRRAPLLTGLPASWFAHPAPGQGTGAPVDPAPAAGATRQNSME